MYYITVTIPLLLVLFCSACFSDSITTCGNLDLPITDITSKSSWTDSIQPEVGAYYSFSVPLSFSTNSSTSLEIRVQWLDFACPGVGSVFTQRNSCPSPENFDDYEELELSTTSGPIVGAQSYELSPGDIFYIAVNGSLECNISDIRFTISAVLTAPTHVLVGQPFTPISLPFYFYTYYFDVTNTTSAVALSRTCCAEDPACGVTTFFSEGELKETADVGIYLHDNDTTDFFDLSTTSASTWYMHSIVLGACGANPVSGVALTVQLYHMCPNGCSGHGACDTVVGLCLCNDGYWAANCSLSWSCTPGDTRTCTLDHGSGEQTCARSATTYSDTVWNTCQITRCDDGYAFQSKSNDCKTTAKPLYIGIIVLVALVIIAVIIIIVVRSRYTPYKPVSTVDVSDDAEAENEQFIQQAPRFSL